jgi:hypothetical protein
MAPAAPQRRRYLNRATGPMAFMLSALSLPDNVSGFGGKTHLDPINFLNVSDNMGLLIGNSIFVCRRIKPFSFRHPRPQVGHQHS